MPARSAGILLYRHTRGMLEMLLVHPGGPFWRNRHAGAWQLPKGLVERGEEDATAARREVAEELGIVIDEPLISLGEIRQAAGKIVAGFAVERDMDPAALVSTMIEIEWPPRSGRKRSVPEVDEACWFDVAGARHCILPSQAPLIDRLLRHVEDPGAPPACPHVPPGTSETNGTRGRSFSLHRR
ncbi:NUDIX domain-containing protein [Sphingomonas immobilis]|uniref:NUDIX domain-containing protein n=1 Tax=Sphingomonas immobilis TaxID=3063997 RepID=A0ABT8ZXS8_9SPHN|nr:NUDIX domain-containing protein [Sphingomonas sp. CA1-15]MDO7841939.1 NUDIX domain-containing protein [Sphingomonas sp. CA1-15]